MGLLQARSLILTLTFWPRLTLNQVTFYCWWMFLIWINIVLVFSEIIYHISCEWKKLGVETSKRARARARLIYNCIFSRVITTKFFLILYLTFTFMFLGCRHCNPSAFVWTSCMHAWKFIKPWGPSTKLCWGLSLLCVWALIYKYFIIVFFLYSVHMLISLIHFPLFFNCLILSLQQRHAENAVIQT